MIVEEQSRSSPIKDTLSSWICLEDFYDISQKQKLVEELKPVVSPPAKQKMLPSVKPWDFKVINANVEQELPGSFQLLNTASKHYGQIIGKEGKNVRAFQEAHGVKMAVTPSIRPHRQVRVLIIQRNNEELYSSTRLLLQYCCNLAAEPDQTQLVLNLL
ncbi:hypothetical protein GHT06_009918 [Daphnia sinensis]|uniref:K Homology domain-containing protein n=1 Tax=Daphnia sinensis TaxID=1820382 RepID=A0AAD5KXY7_9CRUS|nr:hypothetical protein GHT06_009918 [Daphnia sinensis]